MFGGLAREIDVLVNNVIELCYFMRGSISYEEMMMRTPGELQRISGFLSTRLEKESKSQHPVY